MTEPIYDVNSEWLLEHQGRGIAYLGGLREVLSAKARQAEVVQPRELPDGLLEVRQRGRREPVLMLVEFGTYPEKRMVGQMMDSLRLVRQVRGVLPEGLAVVLREKGTYRVPQQASEESVLGLSRETLSWKVVELWTLPAEEMLAGPDVGIVPLVPGWPFRETLSRCCGAAGSGSTVKPASSGRTCWRWPRT